MFRNGIPDVPLSCELPRAGSAETGRRPKRRLWHWPNSSDQGTVPIPAKKRLSCSSSFLAGPLDERTDSVRRLGADAQPVINALQLKVELLALVLVLRVIGADPFHETSVTGTTSVGHNHSIMRSVRRTTAL